MESWQLKNGVRAVCVPTGDFRAITVEVMLKIGSKYEEPGEFGASHFLEHMAFKGTGKRPRVNDVFNEIDSRGAAFDAATGQEMTTYQITTVKENLEWAIELLSDVVRHPIYSQEEIEKERGVIIEEIKTHQDNPTMGLFFDFIDFMYKGSSGCWDISGTAEDVAQISRESLLNFRKKYFDAKGMVVAAAGGIDKESEEKVKRWIEKYFGGVDSRQDYRLPKVNVVFNQAKRLTRKKDIEQCHFCIGVPGISYFDRRRHALRLAEIILGGNTSSRLFNKIRVENPWAYYVFAASQSFSETGIVGIQAGVRPDKGREAIELAEKEMRTLPETLETTELERAKLYLAGKTKLVMDQSDFWSGYVGEKLLLENRLVDLEKELGLYLETGINEVKQVMADLFKEAEVREVIISR